MSRYFDLSQNTVLFGDTLLPVEAFLTPDTVEAKLVTCVFDFAKNLAELKLSEIQLALYSAFVLLSSGTARRFLSFFIIIIIIFLFLFRSSGSPGDGRDPAAERGRSSSTPPGAIAYPSHAAKGRHFRRRLPGRQTSSP